MTHARSMSFVATCLFVCLTWLASCTEAPPPPGSGGTLEPGTSLSTGSGVVLGAPTGALEAAVEVSVATHPAPDATVLPDGADPLGSAMRITPSRDLTAPTDAPLLVGLPIPEGQATDHLAAAVLIPADAIDYDVVGTDPSVVPGDTWQLLPGQVDDHNGLFVTALTGLPGTGQTLVLVQAPEADSPTLAAAAAPAPHALSYTFSVYCRGFAILGRGSECTSADETAAAQALSDVFHDLLGQGFEYPRLRHTYVTSGLFPPKVTALAYEAYLRPFHVGSGGSSTCRIDPSETSFMTGVYFNYTGKIVVCLGQPKAPTFAAAQTLVMRHEYFHATQYAYTSSAPSWFKESTAVASEQSLASFHRSPSQSPHHADVYALSDTEMYRLQDFWVYLGKRNQLALRDLIPFLRAGGGLTDVEQVLANDPTFGSLGGLGPTYWAWIKDQAFEQSVPLAGTQFQTRCAPYIDGGGDLPVLKHPGPTVLTYDGQTASAPVQASLHALTSAIYRLDLTALPAGDYQVTPTVSTSAPRVKAKFYDAADAGTSACDGTPDGTSKTLTVTAGHDQQWYLLVANTDTHDPADVTVSLTGTASAGVSIVQPVAGTSVEETRALTLQAQPYGFGTDAQNVQVTWTYPRWDGVPVTAAVTQGTDAGTLDGLCDGTYTLTATARDPATGRSASDEVTVTVTQPSYPPAACAPSVTIADPADGSTYLLGTTIDFRAVIDDDHPETDAPVFPLTWYDGGVNGVPIQSDLTSMSRSDLGLGTHTIAVVYGIASDTITVTIVDSSNTPPTAAMAFPGQNETLLYSDYNAGHPSLMYVPLGGNGFDAEDGVPGLSWFYRKVGTAAWTFIGNGRTPTWVLAFEQGNVQYEVRLLAVDSGGLQDEVVHTVTVQGPTG